MNAQVAENLCSDSVIAQVRGKSELFVGFNCVEAAFLQAVGLELVDQADASSFLA